MSFRKIVAHLFYSTTNFSVRGGHSMDKTTKRATFQRVVVTVLALAVAPFLIAGCLSSTGGTTRTKDFLDLVIAGTPQDVRTAISNGADLKARNEGGDTALILAASYNKSPEVISILLKAGADLEAKNADDRTALILAAMNNGNPEVIATLLEAGADKDARDREYGMTALMRAAMDNGNPEVVATLLKAGADLEAKSENGKTALILAAMGTGNPEVIMVLLNAGAEAQAKDNTGQTAVYYARYNANLKGTDALRKLEEASR
ncbi:MAG: ankyrin repeat domain-containing protein [Spirochaetia bacterium]